MDVLHVLKLKRDSRESTGKDRGSEIPGTPFLVRQRRGRRRSQGSRPKSFRTPPTKSREGKTSTLLLYYQTYPVLTLGPYLCLSGPFPVFHLRYRCIGNLPFRFSRPVDHRVTVVRPTPLRSFGCRRVFLYLSVTSKVTGCFPDSGPEWGSSTGVGEGSKHHVTHTGSCVSTFYPMVDLFYCPGLPVTVVYRKGDSVSPVPSSRETFLVDRLRSTPWSTLFYYTTVLDHPFKSQVGVERVDRSGRVLGRRVRGRTCGENQCIETRRSESTNRFIEEYRSKPGGVLDT